MFSSRPAGIEAPGAKERTGARSKKEPVTSGVGPHATLLTLWRYPLLLAVLPQANVTAETRYKRSNMTEVRLMVLGASHVGKSAIVLQLATESSRAQRPIQIRHGGFVSETSHT